MEPREFSNESVLKIENVLDTDFQWGILQWRNDENVRRYMIDDTVISEKNHGDYLESLRRSDSRRVYVLTDRDVPLIVWNVNADHGQGAFFTGYYGVGGASSPAYALYSSFVLRDSLFEIRPSYELRSVVLLENEKSWKFLERSGYDVSEPYLTTLKSGRETEVVDVRCNRDMWLAGSAKMRKLYDGLVEKAKFAQKAIVW